MRRKPNKIFHSRKRREAWRLTVLPSAMPLVGDGERGSLTPTDRTPTMGAG